MKVRKRTKISIIINSDNDPVTLKSCLDSFFVLNHEIKNVEFVIVNNYKNERSSIETRHLVSYYDSDHFLLFQAQHRQTSAQMRNIGMELARGSWLLFIDFTERATKKMIHFLNNQKLNVQTDFYRFPIMTEKKKKKRIGLFKTRYYSNVASSLLINEEFLDKTKIKWEPNVNFGETLLLLNKFHSIRNVNFEYLKSEYSMIHSFINDKQSETFTSFYEVVKTYDEFMKEKKLNYKQFIIALFYYYVKNAKHRKDIVRENWTYIKKLFKMAKINYLSYFKLGPSLFLKTIKFRWWFLF